MQTHVVNDPTMSMVAIEKDITESLKENRGQLIL